MIPDPRHDTSLHVAAARAALNAQLAPYLSYEWGRVPGEGGSAGTLPAGWALVSVAQRSAVASRLGSQSPLTSWRMSVLCVADKAENVRWALYRTALALNEESLTIAGSPTSELVPEPGGTRDVARDGDRHYSAKTAYVYAL